MLLCVVLVVIGLLFIVAGIVCVFLSFRPDPTVIFTIEITGPLAAVLLSVGFGVLMLSFVVFLVAGLVGLIQVFSGCGFLAGPPV